MRQHIFENYYRQTWHDFEAQLQCLEQNIKKQKAGNLKQDIDFPDAYQNICQHLAIAEARGYSPRLTSRLRQLVQRGHRLLYRHRSHLGQRIIEFISYGFPQSIRQDKKLIISATLLFYGAGLLTALITYFFPDFIHLFMSASEIDDFEKMYDPVEKIVGPLAREGGTNWMMFGYYIYNNIGIAFITFASGIIFCLGSLFYLLYNGLFMGVVAAHLTLNGYGQTFWPFVIGHSSFELTAIIISAAAGLKLGLAVLIPHRKTRAESLRYAASNAIKLVTGAFIMLIIAAFIEAYWSSMNTHSTLRYTVGGLLWILLICYFLLAGRTRQNNENN